MTLSLPTNTPFLARTPYAGLLQAFQSNTMTYTWYLVTYWHDGIIGHN